MTAPTTPTGMLTDLRPDLWMPVPWSGCWEWIGSIRHHDGKDPRAQLMIGGQSHLAARLFYKHYNGSIPDGMQVCHRCDNGLCVNPAHLFLGTQLDNMRDMVAKGRHNPNRGATNGRAKLTQESVNAIRARKAAGEMGTALAREYGVCSSAIYKAVKGGSWTL